MILYALLDKKSGVLDYFIGSCDEDAIRIATVMMMSSRPIYEFADDFALVKISELVSSRELLSTEEIVIDGFEIKRRLDALREERENAKVKV